MLPEDTTTLPQMNPAWSPDGQHIAFDDGHTIYVVDADGTQLRAITQKNGDSAQPAWSPDGRRFAFATSRAGANWQIAVVNVDGSGLRLLTDVTHDADLNPVWSPDGSRIAFLRRSASDQHIYIVSVTGDASPRQLLDQSARVVAFDWSPDGRQIAFLSVQALASECGGRWKIGVVDGNGTNMHILADGLCNSGPAWQPAT